MLGYSPRQMRILIENRVLDGIRHQVGCDAYYLLVDEVIAFRRRRIVNKVLAETIEFYIGDLDEGDE